MLGIDVYQRYDTITDWRQLKTDGVGACWIKLTDGSGRANTPGDAYVNDAKAVAIPVGGYHFAEAFPQPENQAAVFAAEITRLNALDIAPMLDLEGSIPNPQEFRVRFWQHFNQINAVAKYLTYASESWWTNGQLTDTPVTPGEMIWVARYGANTGSDQGTSLADWDVHQFTSQGVLAGANGFLDLDNVKGDVFLHAIPIPVPPVPPVPPSPDWEQTIMNRLPELQQGSRDNPSGVWWVHRVQALLRDVLGVGIGPSGVDGVFGPATASAVRAAQSNHHLAVDGVVGPHTWSVLITGSDL